MSKDEIVSWLPVVVPTVYVLLIIFSIVIFVKYPKVESSGKAGNKAKSI